MIPLFCGFDERESVGFHAFSASVIENSSEPVAITPLSLQLLQKVYKGGQKDGTNRFIYSRFLVPYLMKFNGFAIFVDGADMICRGDIAELWNQRSVWHAVQVVKHDYKTKFPRKYLGTPMEADNADYPCKNWSSVMIINCSHYGWRQMTPKVVEESPGHFLHRFKFLEDRYIGELGSEWNWLADEYGENPEAQLLHWTTGIPGFPQYKDAPHADDWFKYHRLANHSCVSR